MKVEYISHMGDDKFIANVARVSFNKWNDGEFTTREMLEKGSDEGLIQYLAKHNHWTPFGHPAITLRFEAPTNIRTQCFKHQVGFVPNEVSRRYVDDEPEIYIPESFRCRPDGGIKQGSGDVHALSSQFVDGYKAWTDSCVDFYNEMIKAGVCPEQARFVLPQGMETQWIWTGSLAAYARFFNLRTKPDSQKEIQWLARMAGDIIAPLFPYAWKELTRDV